MKKFYLALICASTITISFADDPVENTDNNIANQGTTASNKVNKLTKGTSEDFITKNSNGTSSHTTYNKTTNQWETVNYDALGKVTHVSTSTTNNGVSQNQLSTANTTTNSTVTNGKAETTGQSTVGKDGVVSHTNKAIANSKVGDRRKDIAADPNAPQKTPGANHLTKNEKEFLPETQKHALRQDTKQSDKITKQAAKQAETPKLKNPIKEQNKLAKKADINHVKTNKLQKAVNKDSRTAVK